MKSAAECFRYATRCERLAADIANEANRQALRDVAGQWRDLAKAAQEREVVEARMVPARQPA